MSATNREYEARRWAERRRRRAEELQSAIEDKKKEAALVRRLKRTERHESYWCCTRTADGDCAICGQKGPLDAPGHIHRHEPLRPGDRPSRFDDVFETDEERRDREYAEWSASIFENRKKLSDDDVRKIRALAKKSNRPNSEPTFKDLARMFGVAFSTIYEVVSRKTRKDLE